MLLLNCLYIYKINNVFIIIICTHVTSVLRNSESFVTGVKSNTGL